MFELLTGEIGEEPKSLADLAERAMLAASLLALAFCLAYIVGGC